jgi:hypothetical protein
MSRKIKNVYVGMEDIARRVKKCYIGVSGIARQFFWESEDDITLSAARYNLVSVTVGNYAIFAGGADGSLEFDTVDVFTESDLIQNNFYRRNINV